MAAVLLRERTSVRLLAFALAAVLVFAVAFAVGAAYGPSEETPDAPAPTRPATPSHTHAEVTR